MNLMNQVCVVTGGAKSIGLARHRWIPDYTEAEIDLMLDACFARSTTVTFR